MAYIKIFGIKSTVKKAVDYITNPDKTDEQNLVSSYGCSPETADLEFAMTAKLGKDNVMEKGDNLAWHMIISFKPGEITDPHIAHEVATKIADATLKGKHEYVLSTHVDKDHVHCHLIFNATNFVDYHKYISNKRNYHKICKLSNRICREYGLECYFAWTENRLYGHVANVVRIDGVWYVLDTQAGCFLTENMCEFTEIVDANESYIASADIISSVRYE